MNFQQEQRKILLSQIKSTFIELQKRINKSDKTPGIDKEKLIADICYQYGSRREKAIEYIKELKSMGVIEDDKYGLWPGFVIKNGLQEDLDGNSE